MRTKALDFLWNKFQDVADPKLVVPYYITPNNDALQSDYKAESVSSVCFLWSCPNPSIGRPFGKHCLDPSS